jgi:uncharacterized protein YegL
MNDPDSLDRSDLDHDPNSAPESIMPQVASLTKGEVYILNVLVDDSGSISMAENSQLVRDGFNKIIADLRQAPASCEVFVLVRYLNGTVLCSKKPLAEVPLLDEHNYKPNGQTPLYDQSYVSLKMVEKITSEFVKQGRKVMVFTLIITDGHDQHSQDMKASDVKRVVTRLMKTGDHIVSGMGIFDGATDFFRVFNSMGIPNQLILTTGPRKGSIRDSFNTVSSVVSHSSISRAGFSNTSMSGFRRTD